MRFLNSCRRLQASFIAICAIAGCMVSCTERGTMVEPSEEEDERAMTMFQGIWLDSETESVAFRVEGDTVHYPDATNMPTHYSIIGDTLLMGTPPQKYPIQKQSDNLFWFRNNNGDLIKLIKSNDSISALAFAVEQPTIAQPTEVMKSDTVVHHQGERYHCYVAVNPTKYKVVRTAYNDDGVAVERIYFDNIIHLSVFHGASRLYSSDFSKKMFAQLVPEQFLNQAILSDISYDRVGGDGFRFLASLCLPDAASCYVVCILISLDGEMTMQLES